MLKLLKRAIARAGRIARMARLNYVRYNRRFRPKAILKLKDASIGVKFTEIHPAFTSKLNLGSKFIKDCSPYIRPPVSVDFPASFVATIKNGRIFAYDSNNFAVITEDNRMVEEASFQWVNSPVPASQNMVFRTVGFTRPKKYSGTIFSLLTMGAAKYYYFHWMFDVMTKLELLKRSGLFDTVDYFLVPSYHCQFHKEYLAYFNIPEHKIIDSQLVDHVQADNLIVSSEVRLQEHLPKWCCDFFYKNFVQSAAKKRCRRIYIARGDAARSRKVSNEAEVIDVLQRQGFEILYLTKVSVIDQVKIFNEAELIVAVHGGGLSNLVYCEPGTTLLELFPDQYVRHYYYDICVKRNITYDYLLCESDKSCDNLGDGELVGLTADIDAIQNKVDILKRRRHTEKEAETKVANGIFP
jgi:hypothetical protein